MLSTKNSAQAATRPVETRSTSTADMRDRCFGPSIMSLESTETFDGFMGIKCGRGWVLRGVGWGVGVVPCNISGKDVVRRTVPAFGRPGNGLAPGIALG